MKYELKKDEFVTHINQQTKISGNIGIKSNRIDKKHANKVDQSIDNLEYGLKSKEENTLLPKESENLLSRYGGME